MATYTTNYQLHQWEPGDNFLRTDFNADFAKIDAAIKGVEPAANTALAGKADGPATQAALAAKAELVTGSYVGEGGTKYITLGFQPRLVIVPISNDYEVVGITGGDNPEIGVNSTGFEVFGGGSLTMSPNQEGETYVYAALR